MVLKFLLVFCMMFVGMRIRRIACHANLHVFGLVFMVLSFISAVLLLLKQMPAFLCVEIALAVLFAYIYYGHLRRYR